MKIIQSFTTGVALLTGFLLFADQARAEIVFDNSENYLTNFYASTLEYGDELHLAGTARNVTIFQFEYFGDFLGSGDETTRVRFYANDGPGKSPMTMLYDSGLFPVFPGYNTVPLTGISVLVPDVFTWTVQFGGLTGRPGDEAALIFYSPPTIGATLPGPIPVIGSYDDYWKKLATGWTLFNFQRNPVANFGVRVVAYPDPPILITSSNRLADRTYELKLSGPIGQAIIIEGSTNQVNWTPLATNTFTNSVMTFVDSDGGSFSERFYRVIAKTDSLNLQSIKHLATGAFQLEIAGPPDRILVIEASSDFLGWTPISTNRVSLVGSPVTFVDNQATNFHNRFYRAQLVP